MGFEAVCTAAVQSCAVVFCQGKKKNKKKLEGIMIQFYCYYETGVKPKINCKS